MMAMINIERNVIREVAARPETVVALPCNQYMAQWQNLTEFYARNTSGVGYFST